ncbi:hypothetical protein LZ198_11270 [Myxococcus sp. K15C18031901]|uniref:hypothetical protein n=1 Tax=Myxococcus dinghuensis TaxID=2906761 RepID=UPI0020A796D7|nr:hypothetical protein [Myxococcus dinghuensis]MCP3099450.1 hypothetical protein [Myxococcus dinghuensis]
MKRELLCLGLLLPLGGAPAAARASPFERPPSPAHLDRPLPDPQPRTLDRAREGTALHDAPRMSLLDLGHRGILSAGLRQLLDLRVALTEWLDLTGYARVLPALGARADALLVDGATLELIGGAGGVVRLSRDDTRGPQVSVRGHFGFAKGREATLLPLVEAILDSPGVTMEQLVEDEFGEFSFVPEQEATVNGGVFVVQALSPIISLQCGMSAEFAWQNRRPFDSIVGARRGESTHAVRVFMALAVTADLSPATGVPVALMGEYVFRTGAQERVGADDTLLEDNTVGLGVFYSGRSDLQVGLGAVATLDAEPELTLDDAGHPVAGQVLLRYNW